LQISSKKFAVSNDDGNIFKVAKDHELPGIFDRAKSAPANFMKESLSPDQAFHIVY